MAEASLFQVAVEHYALVQNVNFESVKILLSVTDRMPEIYVVCNVSRTK